MDAVQAAYAAGDTDAESAQSGASRRRRPSVTWAENIEQELEATPSREGEYGEGGGSRRSHRRSKSGGSGRGSPRSGKRGSRGSKDGKGTKRPGSGRRPSRSKSGHERLVLFAGLDAPDTTDSSDGGEVARPPPEPQQCLFPGGRVRRSSVHVMSGSGTLPPAEPSPPSPPATVWRFLAQFGSVEAEGTAAPAEAAAALEAERVTAMRFSRDGEALAVGDAAGRVSLLFDRLAGSVKRRARRRRQGRPTCKFHLGTEMHAHCDRLDPCTAQTVPGTVRDLAWLDAAWPGPARLLLTTTAQEARLWSVREPGTVDDCGDGDEAEAAGGGLGDAVRSGAFSSRRTSAASAASSSASTREPPEGSVWPAPRCRRTFGRGHLFAIHSVSPCSDGSRFLTADELRVNLWDLEREDAPAAVLDTTPERLAAGGGEVASTASFHPTSCWSLLVGSRGPSGGRVRLYDTRQHALLNRRSAQLIQVCRPASGGVASARFSGPNGRLVCTRDANSVKLWDLRMAVSPVWSAAAGGGPPCSPPASPGRRAAGGGAAAAKTGGVLAASAPEPFLFSASASPDASRVVTGLPGGRFAVHCLATQAATCTVAARADSDAVASAPVPPQAHAGGAGADDLGVLHTEWNPARDALAVAVSNRVLVFEDLGGGA